MSRSTRNFCRMHFFSSPHFLSSLSSILCSMHPYKIRTQPPLPFITNQRSAPSRRWGPGIRSIECRNTEHQPSYHFFPKKNMHRYQAPPPRHQKLLESLTVRLSVKRPAGRRNPFPFPRSSPRPPVPDRAPAWEAKRREEALAGRGCAPCGEGSAGWVWGGYVSLRPGRR